MGMALRIEICREDGYTPDRELTDRIFAEGMKGDLDARGKKMGLVLDVGGYYKNVFTLAPSFDMTEQEIDLGVELLEQLIRRCAPDRRRSNAVVGSSSRSSGWRCGRRRPARRRLMGGAAAGGARRRCRRARFRRTLRLAAARSRLLSRGVPARAASTSAASIIRRSSATSTRPARICASHGAEAFLTGRPDTAFETTGTTSPVPKRVFFSTPRAERHGRLPALRRSTSSGSAARTLVMSAFDCSFWVSPAVARSGAAVHRLLPRRGRQDRPARVLRPRAVATGRRSSSANRRGWCGSPRSPRNAAPGR